MGGRKLIQSIDRAVALLEFIAREGGSAKLQSISDQAGIRATTAHNILATLEALGYVKRNVGDVRYHLGERILNLARIAGDDNSLRARLRPVLETIAAKASETTYLAVPSGDEVYYLDAIECAHDLKVGSPVGKREALEGTAIGLVFLAFMPGLRKRVLSTRSEALGPSICEQIDRVSRLGYAVDVESYRPGMNCVAVPFWERGEVRACFGISGPSSRLARDELATKAWMMMHIVTRFARDTPAARREARLTKR